MSDAPAQTANLKKSDYSLLKGMISIIIQAKNTEVYQTRNKGAEINNKS